MAQILLTVPINLLTVNPRAAKAEAAAAPATYLLDPIDFPTDDKAKNIRFVEQVQNTGNQVSVFDIAKRGEIVSSLGSINGKNHQSLVILTSCHSIVTYCFHYGASFHHSRFETVQ